MIIEAIVSVFLTLLSWAPLPEWESLDIDGSVDTVFAAIGPYLGLVGWINNYFPLAELLGLAALLSGLWVAAHLYHGAIWVLSKLHIAGGGSS